MILECYAGIINLYVLGLATALITPFACMLASRCGFNGRGFKATCQVEVSINGVVDPARWLDYFADYASSQRRDYAGGKTFNVNVVSCDNIQTTQSQMKLDFPKPQAGALVLSE